MPIYAHIELLRNWSKTKMRNTFRSYIMIRTNGPFDLDPAMMFKWINVNWPMECIQKGEES